MIANIRRTWVCTIFLVLVYKPGLTNCCTGVPEGTLSGKSHSDGRFRLRIMGNPEKYKPGSTYSINITGINAMDRRQQHTFMGFILAVNRVNENTGDLGQQANEIGNFLISNPALARYSEKCPNMVTHSSTLAKTYVQINWSAPTFSAGCLIFQATVIEHRDIWYLDDEYLSKVLCEDDEDVSDAQTPVLDPCCACDEAKYELTFEGLWSRHTHPKDFPSNSWMTRFSDIIGASHTVDYRFWQYGEQASEGLKDLAEHGSTRLLESELKEKSDDMRTIIKARGMSYPNVTGKTFAVFRVDSRHHLMSIVSMIDPSPDWIVGVSGLELCLENCSWIEYKVQNLYPWDAGTDSGPTYISPDQPTVPRDVIRRIGTNYPNDPRSPFYNPGGNDMKPLARIIITRQRLYEKSCDSAPEADPRACETTPWNDWTDCSVKCGNGKKHRQRQYKNPSLANQMGCKRKLSDRKDCVGRNSNCDEESGVSVMEYIRGSAEEITPECALTDWSGWSGCSASCGKGTRTKTRKYVNRKAKKMCEAGIVKKPRLEINEVCEGTICSGDIAMADKLERHPSCQTTDWSSWSPCTTTCGNGTQTRQRRIIRRIHPRGENNLDNYDPCKNVKMEETVICETKRSCDDKEQPHFCFLRPKVGHCRTTSNRWYYDDNVKDCAVFSYTGCGGNQNNFMSREKCLETCRVENSFEDIPIEDLKYEHSEVESIDCKVSDWITRPCNATCGEGYQIKTRKILKKPKYNGKECPKKLIRIDKCFIPCPIDLRENKYGWKSNNYNIRYSQDDCEYSDWSQWSPCTATCGDNVVRQRTRTLANPEKSHRCIDRVQIQRCEGILRCLITD